jgi:hypothetical protein
MYDSAGESEWFGTHRVGLEILPCGSGEYIPLAWFVGSVWLGETSYEAILLSVQHRRQCNRNDGTDRADLHP